MLQVYNRPGSWVRYCPLFLSETISFDICDALTSNDWDFQNWIFNPAPPGSVAELICVVVEPDPSGLIASIDSYPDGYLYDGSGNVVDVMEYNSATGCYEPQGGATAVTSLYYVYITGIPVTLDNFAGDSCTHSFFQGGGTAGAPLPAAAITLSTTKQTGFTFTISGSQGEIDWGDASGLEAYDATVSSKSPSHTYASPGTYNVIVYADDLSTVGDFTCNNQSLTGTISISNCINIDQFEAHTNTSLTAVTNPITSNTLTRYYLYDTGVTSLDFRNMTMSGDVQINDSPIASVANNDSVGSFSNFFMHDNSSITTLNLSSYTSLSGYIAVHTNSSMTTLTLPTSGASGVTRIDFKNCAISGSVDMSGLTGCTNYDGSGNSSLTGLTVATSSAAVTNFDFENCNITGTLDLSGLTNMASGLVILSGNSNMTAVTHAGSPGAGSFTSYWIGACDLTGTHDLSNFTALAGYIFLNGNANLTAVSLPSSGASGVTRFQAESCNITGTLDLSSLTGTTRILVTSNSNLTAITNPTNSNTIISYWAGSCDITGTHDMTSFSGLAGDIRINSNSNMTSISWPTVSSGTFSYIWISNCGLTSCDMSPMTNLSGQVLFGGNSGLTTATMPSSSGTLTKLDAASCSLGYFDTTGLTFSAAAIITHKNNSKTAGEVNHFLVDYDNNLPTSGVTGSIDISGTNAAPDGSSGGYDGTTAKSNLITSGWTVTTS